MYDKNGFFFPRFLEIKEVFMFHFMEHEAKQVNYFSNKQLVSDTLAFDYQIIQTPCMSKYAVVLNKTKLFTDD